MVFGLAVAVIQVRLTYREDPKQLELRRWLAEEQAKEGDPEYQELVKLRDEVAGLRAAKEVTEQQCSAVQAHSNSLQTQISQLQQDLDRAQTAAEAAKRHAEEARHKAEAASAAARRQAAAGANCSSIEPPAGGSACADRHTPWRPSPERDAVDPALAAVLRAVAKNNEILVAVSNINYAWPGGMLSCWIENVRRAGVTNAMVVALDEGTKTNVEAVGFPVYRMELEIPDSQKNVGSNHAVSALKFRILTHFVRLGYAVFLSDVDIVTLQNPFHHLVRDSDVESMTDGWDQGTAYGYNDVADDPSMGWARYAHSMRVFVFNSGLFYIRPTNASMDLLNLVIHRVETENGWDQALFNECIFFPSRPGYKDPSVTRRVLDYTKFMNSKFLFKHLRHDAGRFASVKPVMVHVNYHPDKFERMKAVVKRYVDGDAHALDRFPDGSS